MENLYPFLLLICLLLVALFAASEAALAATNRVRLRQLLRAQVGEENAPSSSDLSSETQRFIASVTIAANVPLVAAACLTTWLSWDRYGAAQVFWWSLGIALGTVALFQIAPRLVLSQSGAKEKLWWVRPARLVVALLFPLVAVLMAIGRLLLKPTGLMDAAKPRTEAQNAGQIRDLVESANSSGALEESKELIESIFTFGDTRVHEIMVPRPDIVALPLECDAAAAIELFEESGLSRLPLYEGSIDRVSGILHVKDVLASLGRGEWDFSPQTMLRQPLFLPESQKIDDALAAMRAQKNHLAFVMDEFGGTAGLLTVEDILEELVGEIADEHDRKEEDPFVVLDENRALVDARFHIEDLKSEWELTLQSGEFDTVGGLMIEQLGRELRAGDRLELAEATLTVQSMSGRRPRKILVARKPKPIEENE